MVTNAHGFPIRSSSSCEVAWEPKISRMASAHIGEHRGRLCFADLFGEKIDTTPRDFLAISVACVRCHNQKFDPIPQEDDFALAGRFRRNETHDVQRLTVPLNSFPPPLYLGGAGFVIIRIPSRHLGADFGPPFLEATMQVFDDIGLLLGEIGAFTDVLF